MDQNRLVRMSWNQLFNAIDIITRPRNRFKFYFWFVWMFCLMLKSEQNISKLMNHRRCGTWKCINWKLRYFTQISRCLQYFVITSSYLMKKRKKNVSNPQKVSWIKNGFCLVFRVPFCMCIWHCMIMFSFLLPTVKYFTPWEHFLIQSAMLEKSFFFSSAHCLPKYVCVCMHSF